MTFEIIRQESDVQRKVWWFSFTVLHGVKYKLLLNNYYLQTRKSTHHAAKWVKKDYSATYERYGHRDSMSFSDVPLPDDVIAEVKGLLLEEISKVEIDMQVNG